MVEFTFENDSSDWIQIDWVNLDIGSPAKNRAVLVPWGSDIDLWEAAISSRNAIRNANTQTALTLLAIGGTVGQVAGRGHASARLGGVVQAGAIGALIGRDLAATAEAAETVDRFPFNHLLTLPIRIPPGLFGKRWILLNTAGHNNPCVDSVVLTYESTGQPPAKALFKFKVESEWQAGSCVVPSPFSSARS